MAFGTVLVVDRFAARRGGRRTCGLRARRAARHQGSAGGDSCKDPQRTSCVGHEASPRVVERRPFYLNSLLCSRGGSESVVTPEGSGLSHGSSIENRGGILNCYAAQAIRF
jgi:hypothetical protein